MEFVMVVAVLLVAELNPVSGWQQEWQPNYVSRTPDSGLLPPFIGQNFSNENFKLLMMADDVALVGAKNRLYFVSVKNLTATASIDWNSDNNAKSSCERKNKPNCENYIRVAVKKSDDQLLICGTHSYFPRCRNYKKTQLNDGSERISQLNEESGVGLCPFDSNHNSTAIYTDGSVYSATSSDPDYRDPLILQKNNENSLVRTQPRDSIILNEPDFVSSFDKDDKVFFFFREMAVENINCGKAVFSRVGRVCKSDKGGAVRTLQNTFTTFFKARINCSMPGEFPFYFDEIQSTTEFGQGNHKPTKDSGARTDMIYAVFNTPENAIRGSAVCAYNYSTIAQVFKGRFKGQESYNYNWLPVSWDKTPKNHPETCENRQNTATNPNYANFVKGHPLMDEAVQPSGGMPMLVFTSFSAKFTHIAVDWQVLAADKTYYDVMFVGTDDGRVIKAINKGTGREVESVVIEDIQVLPRGVAVTGLKVYSDRTDHSQQRLIVLSRDQMLSLPLHRCSRANTCSSCVALQDPYCAWNMELKQCLGAETGIQSIATGVHNACKPDVEAEPKTEAPEVLTTPAKCTCSSSKSKDETDEETLKKDKNDIKDNAISDEVQADDDLTENAVAGAAMTVQSGGVALEILVTAVTVSILLSLVLGFFIGYKFQSCRASRDSDVFYKTSSLQRGRNRLSSGDNPYFHTDPKNMHPPKQMNMVLNLKNGKANTVADPKPLLKSNKVYL